MRIKTTGFIQTTENSDEFSIGDRRFRFGPAYAVNGTHFDQQSQQAMVGGHYEALLIEAESGWILTAAVPTGLFSATAAPASKAIDKHFQECFPATPGKFSADVEVPAYKEFVNYRKTLITKAEPKPGDLALILTFSGAQGDDPTAILGHFAFGEATVGENGELEAAINNFYPVKNEKHLVPGFMDPIEYFGDLTSGQSQYRSTSTLVVYGLPTAAILKAKAEIEKTFAFLLAHPEFEVVVSYNCTTETCRALKMADLDPNAVSSSRAILPIPSLARKSAGAGATSTTFERVRYFLFTDPAQIIPRLAFENALSTALREGTVGDEKLSRLDYIYQGQLPSARKVGMLAASTVPDYLKLRFKFALSR